MLFESEFLFCSFDYESDLFCANKRFFIERALKFPELT